MKRLILVMRVGEKLKEVIVIAEDNHERIARDFLSWSCGKQTSQIGSFGDKEVDGPAGIHIGSYYK